MIGLQKRVSLSIDDTGTAPSGRRRRPGPVWILPAVVVLLVVVMTALGISGSSVATLRPDPAADPDLLVGLPRGVRSDEWNTRTPLVSGQVADGLSRDAAIGIGEHDMSVLYDLPTTDWSMTFKPHLWGYAVLPLENAFAFEWWAVAGALVLGMYAFVLVLVGDWRWAALAGVAVYASPFFHWWYLSSTFCTVAYACAATAALLTSFRSKGPPWQRWLLVGAGGYLLAAWGVVLYPPFQIPIALVVSFTAVGVVSRWVLDGVTTWRRVVVQTATAAGFAVVVLGLYALTRSSALAAVNGTVYPGRRRIAGGDGDVGQLATSWFGWAYVRDGNRLGPLLFGNQSEASSFLALGVYLLAALPLVWRRVLDIGRPQRLAVIGCVVAIALIGAHMYIGLPAWLTRITLLDRVQPVRTMIGLGVGSILLLVLVGVSLTGATVERWRRVAAGAVLFGITAGAVLTLGQRFQDVDAPFGKIGLVATVAVAAVVAGLYFWRPMVAVLALTVFGLAISLPVNPLYRGLAPLRPEPLVEELRSVSDDGNLPGWLSSDPFVSTVLVASGHPTISGVNLYPAADAWEVLDPSNAYEEVWNRYAHTSWNLVPGTPSPVMDLLQTDVVRVTVDPCGPELTELGVGHVASSQPIEASCLVLDSTTTSPSGSAIYLYDRSDQEG